MVKRDLGPDAIILSTKESQNPHHTAKKVLITAAVAEETYRKKKVVEESLSTKERDKLFNRTAREQKQMIDHVYTNISNKLEEKRRTITERNYATIPDEVVSAETARARVKSNVAKAAAMANAFIEDKPVMKKAAPKQLEKPQALQSQIVNGKDSAKIDELRGEIKRLQTMVQTINQGMQNTPVQAVAYPGSRFGITQEMSPYFEKLVGEGFLEKTVVEVLKQAEGHLGENVRKKGLVEAYIAKWIYANTDIVKEKLKEKFHVFVGPRGVGKTSSLVKMASHLVIKERKRIAVISTDNNKVGAAEQLRIYSQILNVPFIACGKGQNLNQYLAHFNNVDYVLIDTEGQTLSQLSEIDHLKSIIPQGMAGVRVHLVLSAAMKDDELYSIGRRFRALHYHDIMLTNLDQLRRHGVVVNLQSQLKSPYYGFSIGPMIPEDFEWASKERILDLIFKISNSKWEGDAND